MIDRVEQRFALKPTRLVGDTNYGSAAMVGWLVDEKQIEPHVPMFDKSVSDDATFSCSDFQWHEEANEYRCPAGNALRSNRRPFKNPRKYITKADTILYRSSQFDCEGCAMKAAARVPRLAKSPTASLSLRDVARAIAKTDAYKQSRQKESSDAVCSPHKLRLQGPSGV